jgi:hypothetical protein
MQPTFLLPLLAAVLFVLFAARLLVRKGASLSKNSWLFPAALSLAFLLFSLQAVIAEGPFGFWIEHTRNRWGNQIWFDLLLAIGIGWFLVVPHAKALGMRLVPWLVLIVCTGTIGFLAMIARVLYLREHSSQHKSNLGGLSSPNSRASF